MRSSGSIQSDLENDMKTRSISYQQAALEALQEEFRRDGKTLYMSEHVNQPLRDEFGEARVRETPISESAFVGAGVGLAGSGFRPVVDIGMATFGFVAMDQMINQAAKITYMFGGQAAFPILYRMTVGTGMSMAAQHCISPYAMYMNAPGLKIILPSTPYDIKGLMKTAIRDNNPVISFEHMAIGNLMGEVPEEEYLIPLGKADVKRTGTDVTVVALARMVHVAMEAAAQLEQEGISVEIIDPRTLVPLDRAAIRASVGKTGRLVVVDEACQTCGAGAEIISLVVEDDTAYKALKTGPKRVCAPDIPVPFSPPMEQFVAPDKAKVLAAIHEVMR
jgi:acetoin:2,6-dichlorophenolindophenol oxidoreductase subunit beta